MTPIESVTDRSADSETKRKRCQKGLYKQPGSKFWWCAISYRGQLIRQSTGETVVKKARDVLKAKRDELAAARVVTQPSLVRGRGGSPLPTGSTGC